MNNFEWAEAKSVDDIIALTIKGSSIKAGGVDLLDLMKEGISSPSRLVNIRNMPGWNEIAEKDSALHIGPLVTLSALAEHPIVQQKFVALAQSAGHIATPQIRNMATVGGNLLQRPRCWYFRNAQFPCRKKGGEICFAQQGENQYHAIFNNSLCAIVHPSGLATPLVALGAQVQITNAKKETRTDLLEEFLTLPSFDLHRENSLGAGELVTGVIVPAPGANVKSHYHKQGEKESFDWPIADVAAVLEMNGNTCQKASIVLGAAAPVPHRAIEAEKLLKGKSIDDALAREAAKAAMKEASPMTGNGYKVQLFEAIIARTILAALKA